MQPDTTRLADICDGTDGIDSAGERGAGRGHHRNGGDAGGDVGIDVPGEVGWIHAPARVDRNIADVVAADTKQLGRSGHGVVRFSRAVHGRAAVEHPRRPTSRQGTFACGRKCGDVADRAAAGEGTPCGWKAQEGREPVDRLTLELRSAACIECEVDVVRVGQQVGQCAHLEAARPDVGEVARARLGQ